MRKIDNVGNLPKHLQVFAKEVGGALSSTASAEFYEVNTIDEFEKNASEVGYEIVPTVDTSTGRGFLVGFEVTEPKRITTLVEYSTLKIYFTECSDADLNSWVAKMKKHRDEQQADMYRKRNEVMLNRAARRSLKFRGGKS